MNVLLLVLGVVISLVCVYDMIYTILSPRGAGFIADRLTRGIWRASLRLNGYDGETSMLRYIGPILLLIIVLTWIFLLWIGNTLIILSDAEALWSHNDKSFITGVWEKAYFIAYVLSSMGSGDYTPYGDWWKVYTGFISFTGVVFISLGISFLLPIIEAITLKRQVALRIHNLGGNPKNILENYDTNGFAELFDHLTELEPQLLKLAQYHLAYPVIHYFHSEHRFESLPIQLVCLDESMSILMYQVSKEHLSEEQTLRRAYNSMTYYLSTLVSAFIRPGDDEPEYPDTGNLEHINPNNSIRGKASKDELVQRRKLLLAYLQNDGWSWNAIENIKDEIKLDC